jgi:hypothetical protein
VVAGDPSCGAAAAGAVAASDAEVPSEDDFAVDFAALASEALDFALVARSASALALASATALAPEVGLAPALRSSEAFLAAWSAGAAARDPAFAAASSERRWVADCCWDPDCCCAVAAV